MRDADTEHGPQTSTTSVAPGPTIRDLSTRRRGFPGAAIALAGAAGLFLAWQASGALLLIFAGLLFAAILDAGAKAVGLIAPLGRASRVGLLAVILLLLAGTGATTGGYALLQQIGDLGLVLEEQFTTLRRALRAVGVTPQHLGASPDQSYLDLLLPDPSTLFGHAQMVFGTTLGLVGNVIVIAFIGLFVALAPAAYRDGLASLFPARMEEKVRSVLDEMADSLRWWLTGQIATMALMALTTWAMLWAIGLPNALLLGLLAGLLNFIPYVGPVLAAVPILLAAMPHGLEMVGWALGLHAILQSVEGYLIAPLIQRQAVHLPPALSLGGLVVLGALFGGMGVALAAPLLAVSRIAVIRLWVEQRTLAATRPKAA